MNSQSFICPMPHVWNQIYQRLQARYAADQRGLAPPPKPLILAGWNFTSDSDKAERWMATVTWADKYGLPSEDTVVPLDQQYRG